MIWDRKRGRLAAILTVALLACGVPQVASAENVPLPGGAGTGNMFGNYLSGMSCPSAGNCVATGSYTDSAGNVQAMIETESSGTWTSQELNLSSLPSVSSNPTAQLGQLSCPSVGNCVAVGNYEDADDQSQGLIAMQTSGGWAVSQLPLSGLPNTFGDPGIQLNSLSCPSAGNCVAVGSYTDSSHHSQALIATDTGGVWTTQEADLSPLSPYSDPGASLGNLACPSAGNCAAVGTFNDSANQSVAMIVTETDGSWSVSRPDLSELTNLSSTGRSVLWGVSCPSAGNCTADGYYLEGPSGGGGYQPMVLSETAGSWGPAAGAQLPSNVNTPTTIAHLYGLACASAGNCTAIGDYNVAPSDDDEAFTLTETNGSWAAGTELTLPPDAAANPRTYLSSIACTAPGSCLVGGTYYATGTSNEILVARLTAGQWSTAGILQPTTSGAFPINYTSVACTPTGGYCAVGGWSLNWTSLDNQEAFLVDAPAAPGGVSAAATGTSAVVSWTAPADSGGLPVTGYTVTADDQTDAARGGQSVTTTGLVATFTGLTPGDSYTFSVVASSLLGTGIPAATNAVTIPVPVVTTPVTTPTPGGPSPAVPTRAEIRASLAKLLAPRGAASRPKTLRRTHGYTFTYRPLESGRVTVDWYQVTLSGHGKHRRHHRHLVAAGSARTTGTHAVRVHVKLTALGRRLVETGKRLRLTTIASFVSGTTRVTRTHTFTLH